MRWARAYFAAQALAGAAWWVGVFTLPWIRTATLGGLDPVVVAMAVAGILQGVAVGLLLSSWLVVAYALCGAALWHAFVRRIEEDDLERRFGEEYRRYRARVRCWWPRLRVVTTA